MFNRQQIWPIFHCYPCSALIPETVKGRLRPLVCPYSLEYVLRQADENNFHLLGQGDFLCCVIEESSSLPVPHDFANDIQELSSMTGL